MTSTHLRPPGAGEAIVAPSREALGQCRLASPLHTRTEPCHHCGGSGMLRVSDLSYRTCMDCLGLGKLTLAAGSSGVWALPEISGSACASGAR